MKYAFRIYAAANDKDLTGEKVSQLGQAFEDMFWGQISSQDLSEASPAHLLYQFDIRPEYSPIEDVVGVIRQNFGHVNWLRIDSHECHHDDTPSRPCAPWETVDIKGRVPKSLEG